MAKSALLPANPNSYLNDMAELVVSAPGAGGGLTTLPSELVHTIFEHIDNEKDLVNLMVTCKTLTQPAQEALWRICNTKGYAKLSNMSDEKREGLVNWIQRLSLSFEEDGMQPADLSIRPFRLQELSIEHLSTNSLNSPIDISSFVRYSLAALDIRNGATDNFLPALSFLTGLKHLMIGAEVRVQDGDPRSLLRLAKTMPQLVSLFGGNLSSIGLFLEAANHKFMTDFCVAVHVDHHIVMQALQIPNAFVGLRRLCLWTSSGAVCQLLPRLTSLEKLHLNVSTVLLPGETLANAAANVFRAIGVMDKLTILLVLLRGFLTPLPARMFQPLANLTHLEKLTICADFHPNAQLFEVDEFLPLHPSCSLKHLHLQMGQSIPTNWIQDLAKNHPNLEILYLGRFAKFNELSTPFPALREMSFFAPEVPCCQTHMNSHIRQWAEKMLQIAPRLQKFQASGYAQRDMDVKVLYKHGEHIITCVCTSAWDKGMTLSFHRPLIEY